MNSKTRRCGRCGERKTLRSFPKNRTRSLGRDYTCRSCARAIRFERRRAGRSVSTKQSQRRLKLKVMRHYSGSDSPFCACCLEHRIEFLSLDHINGGGVAHRRELGVKQIYAWVLRKKFPEGFRVLCHNCNMAFGLFGICPHQTEREGLPSPGAVLPTRSELRRGLYTESAELLIGIGIYPSLRAVAIASGLNEHSLAQLIPHRNRLVAEGSWPCEVMPRGSFRHNQAVEVELRDGTRAMLSTCADPCELLKRLDLAYPGRREAATSFTGATMES